MLPEQFPVSLTDAIASTALLLTLFHMWLTSFRRGDVRMTTPTMICFTLDRSSNSSNEFRPKIFLRTLLYSTGERGRIIDSMFLKLHWRSASGIARSRTFGFWVFGEDKLSRGSGLYVGTTGVAFNHHFVLADQGGEFPFEEQIYTIAVHATIVGRKQIKLCEVRLRLSSEQAASIARDGAAVFFDWIPDEQRYGRLTELPLPR